MNEIFVFAIGILCCVYNDMNYKLFKVESVSDIHVRKLNLICHNCPDSNC